jgi:hypothetical protein
LLERQTSLLCLSDVIFDILQLFSDLSAGPLSQQAGSLLVRFFRLATGWRSAASMRSSWLSSL